MIINKEDPAFGKMQNVKRRFFALRNGDIADTLRKAGSPYRIIFGLQLPQIVEVASASGIDMELAEALWNNSTTRESRLMAPMVADRDNFTIEDARRWISTVVGIEEIDILCHRLLRHLSFAPQLIEEYRGISHSDIEHYLALRLAINLVYTYPQTALDTAECEIQRKSPLTTRLAQETINAAISEFCYGRAEGHRDSSTSN